MPTPITLIDRTFTVFGYAIRETEGKYWFKTPEMPEFQEVQDVFSCSVDAERMLAQAGADDEEVDHFVFHPIDLIGLMCEGILSGEMINSAAVEANKIILHSVPLIIDGRQQVFKVVVPVDGKTGWVDKKGQFHPKPPMPAIQIIRRR